MGRAARVNLLSFKGKPETEAELVARIKTLSLGALVALWCRLMWEKVRR